MAVELELGGSVSQFSDLKGDISEIRNPRETLDLAGALPRTNLPSDWARLTDVSAFPQLKSFYPPPSDLCESHNHGGNIGPCVRCGETELRPVNHPQVKQCLRHPLPGKQVGIEERQ